MYPFILSMSQWGKRLAVNLGFAMTGKTGSFCFAAHEFLKCGKCISFCITTHSLWKNNQCCIYSYPTFNSAKWFIIIWVRGLSPIILWWCKLQVLIPGHCVWQLSLDYCDTTPEDCISPKSIFLAKSKMPIKDDKSKLMKSTWERDCSIGSEDLFRNISYLFT